MGGDGVLVRRPGKRSGGSSSHTRSVPLARRLPRDETGLRAHLTRRPLQHGAMAVARA